jgi:hypothetical protein
MAGPDSPPENLRGGIKPDGAGPGTPFHSCPSFPCLLPENSPASSRPRSPIAPALVSEIRATMPCRSAHRGYPGGTKRSGGRSLAHPSNAHPAQCWPSQSTPGLWGPPSDASASDGPPPLSPRCLRPGLNRSLIGQLYIRRAVLAGIGMADGAILLHQGVLLRCGHRATRECSRRDGQDQAGDQGRQRKGLHGSSAQIHHQFTVPAETRAYNGT